MRISIKPLYIVFGVIFVLWLGSFWFLAPPEDGRTPRISRPGHPKMASLFRTN